MHGGFQIMDTSIYTLIVNGARGCPEAIAVTAPERRPLTYEALRRQVDYVVSTLNAWGIGRADRVAVVLPNGPDMAVAFVAVTSGATCAPLNPRYREPEFEFFLSDLNAKALIIQAEMNSPAVTVARKRHIPIIRLSPLPEAGRFTLTVGEESPVSRPVFAQPDDVALILHTSGTTSRPKMVPLTHGNLCTSANNIRESLQLTAQDRCLNIMPLFHIHGLVGALLSTLSAGASIVCTPGFHAPKFYDWLKQYQPSWYSAVPTMHQAILARFEQQDDLDVSRLRFIRSSSAALPPNVMAGLESAFHVPVIEAYGMTEASHQMASNPLPPHARKAGSVGQATGIDIAIMDPDGVLLQPGEPGEIVIRGRTVTKGYEQNPEANAKAFTHGWFHTGDKGYLDEDHYLVLQDRLKEIINRGGEKISPREVDEILLSHPDVLQAVTFAVPHPKLGEAVAAAVVLRDSSTVTEWDLQQFVASRVTDFKVPSRVLALEEIPKGPTGKMQRIGMAQRLGVTLSSEDHDAPAQYTAPSTPIESRLASIWGDVLHLDRIGIDDNFFQLGGDSIQAGLILAHIQKTLHLDQIPLAIFLHAPTIRTMSALLSHNDLNLPDASLIALQRTGSRPPFYCIHACEGEVLFLTSLSHHLGPDQPFYALRAQGLDGNKPFSTVEAMATHYLTEIQALQPTGPYLLGGAGVGGTIAWEMAQQLTKKSKDVGLLVLMDTLLPQAMSFPAPNLRHYLNRIKFHIQQRNLPRMITALLATRYTETMSIPYRRFLHRYYPSHRVYYLIQEAADQYHLSRYPGHVVVCMAQKHWGHLGDPASRIDPWRPWISGRFDSYAIPGEHLTIFQEPNVQVLAQTLRPHLTEIAAGKH
jgi:acyl-CoA synthetase (AMP-forming)/AMP-acid ligase II/thioesterase domain-containing protein